MWTPLSRQIVAPQSVGVASLRLIIMGTLTSGVARAIVSVGILEAELVGLSRRDSIPGPLPARDWVAYTKPWVAYSLRIDAASDRYRSLFITS